VSEIWKKMSELSHTSKVVFSVLGSELGGAPVALGAVWGINCFPKQLDDIKKFVAKHIIEPNFNAFEFFSRGLEKSHARYNERKREQMSEEQRAELLAHPQPSLSREQQLQLDLPPIL
jgi:hypothetical protein